jgi:cell division septation protein DedD
MFYIIIGSFINSANAKRTAGEYRRKGYKTSIIKTTNRDGNKLELVSVRTFTNYNEAVTYLKEFQAQIDSAVWLYPVK